MPEEFIQIGNAEPTITSTIRLHGKAHPVFYVTDGVANNVDDKIYLHKGLREPGYADLLEFLLHHEAAHTLIHKEGKAAKAEMVAHLKHDVWMPVRMFGKYFKFILTHRGAWKQLIFLRWIYLPDEKQTYVGFDFNRFIFTFVCIGLLWLIFALPGWFA